MKVEMTSAGHSEQRRVQCPQGRRAVKMLQPRTLLMSQEDPHRETVQRTILQRGTWAAFSLLQTGSCLSFCFEIDP